MFDFFINVEKLCFWDVDFVDLKTLKTDNTNKTNTIMNSGRLPATSSFNVLIAASNLKLVMLSPALYIYEFGTTVPK